MAAPKSREGKAAQAIVKALNQKGLNNSLIAYFITEEMSSVELNDFLDLFFHTVKRINNSPIPDYLTPDEARIRLLTDSIVRAVEDTGMVI